MDNIKSITALRGYSVLLVLLFHLNQEIFTNGFIGVDIFFVISGYLIAKIVEKYSKNEKNFFKHYFSRRLKRIFPGLTVVCLFTLLLGFFILSPNHFEDLQNQIFFSLLGVSNYYFYFNTDYFDLENIYRPLLHLWTIGLELQFYIFYPLLFIIVKKFFKKPEYSLIIAFVVFSLFSFLNYYFFNNFERTSFYSNLRFNEFFIGSIFYYFRNKLNNLIPSIFLYISYIYLLLIQFNIVKINILFFNIEIIVISLAVGIIIIKHQKVKDWVRFDNTYINYLGKISYSLYLFHYPIIIFYGYVVAEKLILIDYLILLFLIISLSILNYHYIEKKFYDFKK